MRSAETSSRGRGIWKRTLLRWKGGKECEKREERRRKLRRKEEGRGRRSMRRSGKRRRSRRRRGKHSRKVETRRPQ